MKLPMVEPANASIWSFKVVIQGLRLKLQINKPYDSQCHRDQDKAFVSILEDKHEEFPWRMMILHKMYQRHSCEESCCFMFLDPILSLSHFPILVPSYSLVYE